MPEGFPPQALGTTLVLLNVLLLLAPLAIVCCFTRDTFTAKGYLFAVALADLGHIYAIYRAVGDAYFRDIAGWNHMMTGNVLVSAALHILRWLTLAGTFGQIENSEGVTIAKKQN